MAMTGEPEATDRRVDALLAMHRVPALAADFTRRVVAAAAALPANPPAATAWPRRTRRPWRRSPLWLGFIALNIVAASAVAAMVSGFPVWHHVTAIAQKVAYSLRPEPAHTAPHRVVRHARAAVPQPARRFGPVAPVAIAGTATLSIAPPARPLQWVAPPVPRPLRQSRLATLALRHERIALGDVRPRARFGRAPATLPGVRRPDRKRRDAAPLLGRRPIEPIPGVSIPPAVPRRTPLPDLMRPVRPYGPQIDLPVATAARGLRGEQRREERFERRRLRPAGPRIERPFRYRPTRRPRN